MRMLGSNSQIGVSKEREVGNERRERHNEHTMQEISWFLYQRNKTSVSSGGVITYNSYHRHPLPAGF